MNPKSMCVLWDNQEFSLVYTISVLQHKNMNSMEMYLSTNIVMRLVCRRITFSEKWNFVA